MKEPANQDIGLIPSYCLFHVSPVAVKSWSYLICLAVTFSLFNHNAALKEKPGATRVVQCT